jgi:hypothetical protein
MSTLGNIYYDYYVCHYIHCNIDGKYIKTILELGAKDVRITNLNYSLSFSRDTSLLVFGPVGRPKTLKN